MLLVQAEELLVKSVVHAGQRSWEGKTRPAIKGAGLRFVRDTGCTRKTYKVPLASGSYELDIRKTIPGFIEDQLIWARIDNVFLELVSVPTVRRELEEIEVNRPTRFTFEDDETVVFDRQADQDYTVRFTRREPFVDFDLDSATADDIKLNIPDEWVYEVVWWGARAWLLKGAAGHREDAEAAEAEFTKVIERAAARFAGTTRGTQDRNVVG